MTKTDYNIIGIDGLIKSWFLNPLQIYNSVGVLKTVREGDFSYLPNGTLAPIMRFDSIPFGGYISGSNMVFQYGISDGSLIRNPKLVCLGSSTMFGHGLSSPNRYADNLSAWQTANATTPTLINLAVEGYTLANIRTVANGGTVGQNIEAACAQNPTMILVDEPTNWASAYDEATQISYMLELFNYGFQRGILVIFNGSRPRTPYSGVQDTRLVNLNTLIKAHQILKFITNINFSNFLQPATVADLRSDYDQGDGIHLNAAGVIDLANTTTAWWTKVFYAVTAFNQYIIEQSLNGGSSWTTFQALTDMTLNNGTYPAVTGLYRARARLKDNTTFTDNSTTTSLTYSAGTQRILIDLGGDGIVDSGQTDGGVMTPSNAGAPGAIPGQAADGKWWNNIVSCVAGAGADYPGATYPITINRSTIVDITNSAVAGMSIALDKAPRGTFSAIDYSMNYGGSTVAVSDYPISAVMDNLYIHTSAGIVTMTFVVPAGKTASIKFWGNRNSTGPRILQMRKAGDTTWLEYDATTNTTYATAVTLTGITGTQGVEMQVKSGSTFGHISVIDISLV
jgi:hypothetical protein